MSRHLFGMMAAFVVASLFAPWSHADVKEDLDKAVALVNTGRGGEARPVFEAALKAGQITPQQRITCYEKLAQINYEETKFEECRSLAQKAFAEVPNAKPDTLVMCQHWVAAAYIGEGKREQAIAELQKAIDMAGDVPEQQWIKQWVQRLIADQYLILGKDKEALEAIQKSIADYPAIGKESLGYSYGVLAAVKLSMGAVDEAIDAFAQRVDAMADQPEQVAWCRNFISAQLVPALSKPENAKFIDPAIEKLGKLIARRAECPPLCEQLQKAMAQLLQRNGQSARALFEAKVLFDVSSADTMPEAVRMLSEILKAEDGSVGRANAFLEYVRTGKAGKDKALGTPDDLADPLGDVQPPDAPARDARFTEALGTYPDDWRGKLSKATLYRYWGKPEQALVELNGAFAICPMEQQPIQLIVDATAQVLVQVSGDPDMAQKFTEFQQLGPAGADGKKGTPDDLTNPITPYLPKK
jgi:tetratricopeptide (TPR) repeat protein